MIAVDCKNKFVQMSELIKKTKGIGKRKKCVLSVSDDTKKMVRSFKNDTEIFQKRQ